MRNLRLEIEYDGTNYAGWQIQTKERGRTIQGVIEKALRKILQEKIHLIASGRTDAGVHALAQVANFKTTSQIRVEKLQRALNGLLPQDIVIKSIEEAPFDFHSRFAAKSKLYRYSILNRPYPAVFLRNRVYFYPYLLDIKIMQKEAKVLLGRHDFKTFCASGSSVKHTVRTIKKISIRSIPSVKQSESLINIDIEADGFLYNMVRNIAGTLIEIGRGRFAAGSIKKVLKAKDRKSAGPTAPSCGLCLMKVRY